MLAQFVQGVKFIGQPVHATLFPYPIAPTVHAARISLAYQTNARAAGGKLPWGTYIIGYLIMTLQTWGGTVITHHLLNLTPPMLYSPTPWTIYLTTHLLLTLLTTLFPAILAPRTLSLLDTVLFPLDALVHTGAVTGTTALLSTSASVSPLLKSSPITHLIIGAFASASGGLSASTLGTWTPSWALSTPPVLRAPTLTALAWGSMDIWGGALVAAVHGTLSGNKAFGGVAQVMKAYGWRMVVRSNTEAKALAAAVLSVCFAARVYRTHWAAQAQAPAKAQTQEKKASAPAVSEKAKKL
ncbi:hypothetical protein H0H92_009835 [Tricholoma furcatifolium]|nr:hypothetical protein H0H92_009835 [Tricholoma furcatifolium]